VGPPMVVNRTSGGPVRSLLPEPKLTDYHPCFCVCESTTKGGGGSYVSRIGDAIIYTR
jgi:hypothetical protein